MCGLVGAAGDLLGPDVKAFNALLYFDYVRGQHSTGVGWVSGYTAASDIVKAATDPLGLMALKAYDTNINAAKSVLMGHNRHATKGSINRVNSHPFQHGGILGAHNGTLDMWCLKDLSDKTDGETDSEQLIASIAELGGDIKSALALVSGAWALTIYKHADKSINFVRNDQRPLFYTFREDRKVIFWASEAWMLNVALTRESIKFGKIFEVPTDTILSWIVPKSGEVFGDQPGREKAEGKQRSNFWHGGRHQHQPWEDWTDQKGSANGSGSGSKSGTTADDDDDEGGWAAYGQGWDAAEAGELSNTNPYKPATEKLKHAQWKDGHSRGMDHKLKCEREARTRVPTSGSVIQLYDKREKKSDIPARAVRLGPGGKYINAGAFRDITKNECGWCNNPITFDDKGHFMVHGATTLFICETHGCTADKTLAKAN